MNWWVVITLIIAAALAYGYWDHNHQRRHLRKSFTLLAEKYGGEVKPGNLLVFPQTGPYVGGQSFPSGRWR